MARAFVMLTCIPPTVGHMELIRYASLLAEDGVTVMLGTMPSEPMVWQRKGALELAIKNDFKLASNVKLFHLHKQLPEDAQGQGFRELWQGMLLGMGIQPGDYIVGSEPYCKWCAEMTDAIWMPFDVERVMNRVSGTAIREEPLKKFGLILPEFRKFLQTTVTIFGAESTGKTRLTRELQRNNWCDQTVEFARPYLENVENRITIESMTNIWRGQAALQRMPFRTPLRVQDTDLYSTHGYWQYWANHYDSLDTWSLPRLRDYPPMALLKQADALKSDLYIITPSEIPFEPDPLRYGGDRREISDEWWIQYAQIHHLNYRVLPRADPNDPQGYFDVKVKESQKWIEEELAKKAAMIQYDRDPARL